MDQIIRIGMDTSKHVFQLHGVNAAEKRVLRKKMRRKEMIDFFTTCPPTLIAIEACGGSHHWARLLTSFGHKVKMIAPQLAKRVVQEGRHSHSYNQDQPKCGPGRQTCGSAAKPSGDQFTAAGRAQRVGKTARTKIGESGSGNASGS